ncbi:MAG: tRNA adenosine(34) deaminase TadA [Pseudohongiellaceae bacterium]
MIQTGHEYWMRQALDLARQAGETGEVPVGAVLVADDRIIGSAYNRPIAEHDPSAHAEILALRSAAKNLNNYRLPGTVLYVTIEPCTMCVGAMLHARIDTLVFGATEPRAGAVVSRQQLLLQDHFNHRIKVISGILARECGALLQEFFRQRRNST